MQIQSNTRDAARPRDGKVVSTKRSRLALTWVSVVRRRFVHPTLGGLLGLALLVSSSAIAQTPGDFSPASRRPGYASPSASVLTSAPAQVAGTQESVVADIKAQIVFINKVDVPAQAEGMLRELLVDEGAIVEAEQELAIIDDRQAQLTLNLKRAEEAEAKLNAENEVNLLDAENSMKLEREKAVAFEKIAKDGAMPWWEYRTQALEAERQRLRLQLAEMNQAIAASQFAGKQFERGLAELEIEKRTVRAPFAGSIEMRHAQLGEWVQAGSPVFELVQMDRLRAQGYAKMIGGQAISVGMPAIVEFVLGNGRVERIEGRVGYVSNDVDGADSQRIWVEIENKRLEDGWMIKPGMKTNVRVIAR